MACSEVGRASRHGGGPPAQDPRVSPLVRGDPGGQLPVKALYLLFLGSARDVRVFQKLFCLFARTTRFFPALFATYRASSARRSKSSPDSSKVNSARPQLAVN